MNTENAGQLLRQNRNLENEEKGRKMEAHFSFYKNIVYQNR